MNRQLLTETGGGFFVVRDRDRVEYVVEIVKDDALFPTLWHKAAMYLHRIARSQAFGDGNKRTALEAATVFLDLNGHTFVPPSPRWTARFMVDVAEGRKSIDRVRSWLKRRSTRQRAPRRRRLSRRR